MKKLLFIIIAIFSLHCPGYSMYTQAGIFTDGADLLGKACEEGGSEQQGPSNMSIVPERTETEPSSLSETEAKAVTKSNYTATTVYNSGGLVGYHEKQFLDGLGNPSEKVYVRYTPNKKDLYSLQEYDAKNRVDKSWLSLPSSGDLGEYIPVDELRNLTCEYYGDTAPYSKTTYFNDPLNRPRAQALPGEALQSLGKATEFEYRLNWQDEVLRMTVRQSGENFVLDASDFYPAGTLTVTKTTDADGRVTYVYTDKSERVVLTTAANARTYYGYDAQGRLVIVVTPEGSRLLSPQYRSELRQAAASATTDTDSLFRFVRLSPTTDHEIAATDTAAIEGLVPAALGIDDLDPENISFDSPFVKAYCFTYRYDGYGDLVARRFPGGVLEEMEYNEKRLLRTRFRGKKDASGTIEYADRYRYDALNRLVAVSRAYYAVSGSSRIEVPSTPVTMVSYYYDSYSNVPSELAYRNDLNSGLVGVSIDYTRLRGLKSYEKVQVLDHKDHAAGYVERAFYYNMEGRLQQIVEKNPLGGIGYFSYAYDFQGNEVFRRERIKPQSGSTEDVLTVLTTYDHAGRVVKEETTFNDSKPVVVNFEYDELGRLVGKDANSITSSYAYNLQGWLTRSSGHYYSSQLKYYDGSNPSYTGNISEWKWGNRSYRFEYDNLGRISDAHYYEGNTLSDDYSEKDISYDLNGNIRSLTRYDAGVPETLDYTYTNGILKAIGNKSIVYDGCGNITFNGRNNLEIDYNFLNLPMRIHSTDGQSVVNYRYLADGSKFSATDDTGEGLIYIGSLVYRFRNGAYELDHAAFSQGFFRKNHLIENHEYVPVYYVCDHLGSPRSLIDHTGELMVLRNYYPFGKTWRRPTEPVYYDYYHFNGKEQQTVGDAGLLDYGARFYDPDIARWLTLDPLADNHYNTDPFVFCANNPIKFIDPNGLDWVRNNKTGEITNRESVTSYKNTPRGYTYIGRKMADLMRYLGLPTGEIDPQQQTEWGAQIDGNSGGPGGAFIGASFILSGYLTIEPLISIINFDTGNNEGGLRFDGVSIEGTLVQMAYSANADLKTQYLGVLSVVYGDQTYYATLRPITGCYIKAENAFVQTARMTFPASMLRDLSNHFSIARIMAGNTNANFFWSPFPVDMKWQLLTYPIIYQGK